MKSVLHIQHAAKPGFTLVIAVMLMVLLTVVAVGLLGLSSIALRSSGQSQAASIARANARLAMTMALGELQSSLGRDMSVSASSEAVIASPKQPHLTGAWESWRWDPATSSSPDYSQKSAKFRRWLVSTAKPEDATSFAFPTNDPAKDAVELVGTLINQGVSNSVRAENQPQRTCCRRSPNSRWFSRWLPTRRRIQRDSHSHLPQSATNMPIRCSFMKR